MYRPNIEMASRKNGSRMSGKHTVLTYSTYATCRNVEVAFSVFQLFTENTLLRHMNGAAVRLHLFIVSFPTYTKTTL